MKKKANLWKKQQHKKQKSPRQEARAGGTKGTANSRENNPGGTKTSQNTTKGNYRTKTDKHATDHREKERQA